MQSIILDLMGGDKSPQAAIKGVLSVAKKYPQICFKVVGTADFSAVCSIPNIEYIVVDQFVPMDADPMQAARMGVKSSMGKAIELAGKDCKSIVLTAGNTAALMSLAYLKLRQKNGKRRPALMSRIDFLGQSKWILDLGANIISTAQDLYENAIFGAKAFTSMNPVVGLLNVGSEEGKGTPLIKEAHALIKDSDLDYYGYIEGNDILHSKVDLIVCNGFEGNLMTKLLESAVLHWRKSSKDAPVISNAALLIGLRSNVYKCHGNSDSTGFEKALEEVIQQHLQQKVVSG
jgi:glycerol-3-phosphate acyltransferase PlsX